MASDTPRVNNDMWTIIHYSLIVQSARNFQENLELTWLTRVKFTGDCGYYALNRLGKTYLCFLCFWHMNTAMKYPYYQTLSVLALVHQFLTALIMLYRFCAEALSFPLWFDLKQLQSRVYNLKLFSGKSLLDYDEDLEFRPSDSELSISCALGSPEYAQEKKQSRICAHGTCCSPPWRTVLSFYNFVSIANG